MRKFIVSIVCGLILCRAGVASAKTVVYFIPHQDDEMYMLGSMTREIQVGNDVYAVMVTDGGRSEVRKKMSTEFMHTFTRQEFSALRNKEFFRVLRIIGFAPTHILFANEGSLNGSPNPTYLDGHLTFEQATEVIQNFYKQHGDGVYATVLADGGHGDHRMLHEALFNFTGPTEKIYYSEQVAKGEKILLSKKEQQLKKKALSIYYEWNPKKGAYAIAAHSVKKLLDFWDTHPYEYVSMK